MTDRYVPEDETNVEGDRGGEEFYGEFGERETGDVAFEGEFGERVHEGGENESREAESDAPID